MTSNDLKRTALWKIHQEFGAKMVPYAGYEMPVQYKLGVMKEHLHCRACAGLFDVSHMGQIILRGANISTIALALETLVPVDIIGLSEGRQRYGFFTDRNGGILDDLMIANRGDHLFIVVNAACKDADIAHLQEYLPGDIKIELVENRALLALQGPSSEQVLSRLIPDVAKMRFMDVGSYDYKGAECWISRSGYTGEDGYEISIPTEAAHSLAEAILRDQSVEPIGLGARDSLRLEAGLCLYGNDIDATTTPVEAALNWAIQKIRRSGGIREGGFLGSENILGQIKNGASRKRVGICPEGRAPVREGVLLFADITSDKPIGAVTSGCFGPSVNAPVSMAYVDTDFSSQGHQIFAELRGKRVPAKIAPLPFVEPNFKR